MLCTRGRKNHWFKASTNLVACVVVVVSGAGCHQIVGIDDKQVALLDDASLDGSDADDAADGFDAALDVAPDRAPDAPDDQGEADVDADAGDSSADAMETSEDAEPDVLGDVSDEPLADALPDVAPEVASDVAPDVAADVVADVAPDVAADVVADVAPDVAADVVADVPQQDAPPEADAPDDAPVDASDESPAVDAPVDALQDAPPVDAGPPTCSLNLSQLSKAPATPTGGFAFVAGLWGVTWVAEDAVHYNAAYSSGSTRFGSDQTVVAKASNTSLASSLLAPSGERFVLAYGKRRSTNGLTGPVVGYLDPETAIFGPSAEGPLVAGTVPVEIEGLAVEPNTGVIAVASRSSATSLSEAVVSTFTSAPLYANSYPLGAAYATGIAWSAATERFGIATIVGNSSAGGKLVTIDATGAHKATFPFTASPNTPALTHTQVDIVAVQSSYYIVWVDRMGGASPDVVITQVDAATGDRPLGTVRVTQSTTSKVKPTVTYDGRSIMVAWIEQPTAGGTYHIQMQRFSPQLQPIGDQLCATCASGWWVEIARFGLASSAPNEYGLSMREESTLYTQHFAHVACTGP